MNSLRSGPRAASTETSKKAPHVRDVRFLQESMVGRWVVRVLVLLSNP